MRVIAVVSGAAVKICDLLVAPGCLGKHSYVVLGRKLDCFVRHAGKGALVYEGMLHCAPKTLTSALSVPVVAAFDTASQCSWSKAKSSADTKRLQHL